MLQLREAREKGGRAPREPGPIYGALGLKQGPLGFSLGRLQDSSGSWLLLASAGCSGLRRSRRRRRRRKRRRVRRRRRRRRLEDRMSVRDANVCLLQI